MNHSIIKYVYTDGKIFEKIRAKVAQNINKSVHMSQNMAV